MSCHSKCPTNAAETLIGYEPEPLNGCHWYTKDGVIPLYIFEMAYVSRLLKIMPTSSGAQLLLCWQ